MSDPSSLRSQMVERQIASRGITDERVLAALRLVPRERFVSDAMQEFAYEDAPLPIESGQTISQPYIVALMLQALELRPGERALEVGTGSGYAAAVMSRLAGQVHTIERHANLAEVAARRLTALGYDNVEVRVGDGTAGWPEAAPFDAIAVAAGGPRVPEALLEQLSIGGRLVIPVGPQGAQRLVRVVRVARDDYQQTDLGGVQFVPLIGAQGWRSARSPGVARLVAESAEPIASIEGAELGGLLERIGDARVVLLGEATHGTSEFYRMRARITRELVLRRGFRGIAVEADWPDAATIDRRVRQLPDGLLPVPEPPFTRFPQWMWRNREVAELVSWLGAYNQDQPADRRVGFHGLDMYSLYTSTAAVLAYLDRVDPPAAKVARQRYGCLTPWQKDPAAYGRAAMAGRWRVCERDVVRILTDLLERRLEYAAHDGERFFDAEQNARLVSSAERYYRIMYDGAAESWNLRDSHMFDTLQRLRAHYGPEAGLVVWEHNSHVGDASATEMSARGEHNLGQLARQAYGEACFNIGFGTDHGTVCAAESWGAPVELMRVRPAMTGSYERLCHDSGVPAFMLPLLHPRREVLRDELMAPRLERAIGVIYRPAHERQSHYFEAVLPRQFDEWIWFDESSAVTPLGGAASPGVPETFPTGL
ncbi:MAG: protein-L-isoaspartate(D-aspartate) O-methyltransferase [Deltaproteobacteria bacterium]|nr:protein-L-isoaspartate(D-aspartate) O-methyltransferase [Deltaproteobacteria bacterium]